MTANERIFSHRDDAPAGFRASLHGRASIDGSV